MICALVIISRNPGSQSLYKDFPPSPLTFHSDIQISFTSHVLLQFRLCTDLWIPYSSLSGASDCWDCWACLVVVWSSSGRAAGEGLAVVVVVVGGWEGGVGGISRGVGTSGGGAAPGWAPLAGGKCKAARSAFSAMRGYGGLGAGALGITWLLSWAPDMPCGRKLTVIPPLAACCGCCISKEYLGNIHHT